eukprot:ANDGO_07059.mRNA.1 Cilia- and flagella-associated protein 58
MSTSDEFVADVSNSVAIGVLDELLSCGRIDATRAEWLRSKYEKMQEMVVKTYEHESQLVAKGRSLKQEFDVLAEKLGRYDASAKEDDAVMESLRSDKAKAELEFAECQEREAVLSIEKAELERQMDNMQSEIQEEEDKRIAALKPVIEKLESGIDDLKKEIERLNDQDQKYDEQRSSSDLRIRQLRHEIENLKEDYAREKEHLRRIENDPEKMRKQVSVASKANEAMDSDLKKLEEKWKEYDRMSAEQDSSKQRIEKEWYDLSIGLESQRSAIEQKQRQLDEFEKNIEIEKERKMELVAGQMDLELRENTLDAEAHRERDSLNKLLKDKDTMLKTIRRLENSIGIAKQQHTDFATQYDLTTRQLEQLENLRKKNAREMEDLKREVDIMINSFLKQEGVEKTSIGQYQAVKDQLKQMEDDLLTLVDEQRQLNNDITKASAIRERASRDAAKVKARLREALDTLKVKQIHISEMERQEDELKGRVTFVENLYTKLKTERNKYSTMIQTSMQKLAEIKEKNGILDNELDVLRRKSSAKDSLLTKERRDQQEKFGNRETLRSEANKLLVIYRQRKSVLDEQLANIERLHSLIENAEEDMLRLKQSYERAVADRNFAGLALIDRNDELCILYEKNNIQETILNEGEMALRRREEELKYLQRETSDLVRALENTRRAEPEFEDLRHQVIQFQNELLMERALSEYLSKALDAPSNTSRWRALGGHDDPPEKLSAKVVRLEERIHAAKEKLLEKQLVADEVNTAIDKLRGDAQRVREPALAVSQQINAYQAALRDKTKKMMALVAELSMVQATAMKLQLERDEVKKTVEDAEQRVAIGEPPTDDAEDGFYRDMTDRLRRQEMLLDRKKQLEAERNLPATITRTTAEPRPNAYIPDDDLGLPRPYGGTAPYRPADTKEGATGALRFFHKPKPREIIL